MATRDGDEVIPGVAAFALFLGRRLLEIAVLAWAVTVVSFV
jgi:hypothetical protein